MQIVAGAAWAALALFIWAGWFAVTRISVTGTLGIYDIAALRLGLGSLVLLPAFVGGAGSIARRGWREAIVLSFCWGAPFVLLVAFGIQLTSAAHSAGTTPSTMPVFAGLIAWAVGGDRPGARRLLGFAVIIAGVVALSLSRPGVDSLPGNAALLGASALWAVYTLRVRHSGLSSLQAATLTSLYSALVYLPIYVLSGVSRLGDATRAELLGQATYQGVLVGAVALLAFNRAVAMLGPAGAGAVTSLVPVVAALLAIPIAGEMPGAVELASIIAIACGVGLTVWSPQSDTVK